MAKHPVDGLMNWLGRDEWRDAFTALMEEHLGEACAAVDLSVQQMEELIDDVTLDVLWGCVFEDFLTREDDHGRNIVDDYLKRRGFRETASSRAYLQGLRHSVMSLYEVSDLRPGESFLARDLIRGGEPVRVSEKAGSRQLQQWDQIAARIVRVGPKTVMGGGLLPFGRQEIAALFERISEATEGLAGELDEAERQDDHGLGRAAVEAMTDDLLGALAPAFTTAWLVRRLEALVDPSLPEMRNSDGEALVFTEVRYPVRSGATLKAVRARLDGLPALEPETSNFWNWLQPKTSGRAARSRPAVSGLAIATWAPDGSTVLGTIEIKDRSVVLSVNSTERAARGQALLGPALAALAGAPELTARSLEEVMADRGADPAADPASAPALPPDEQYALMCEWMDGYYSNLLDEPVPMLGGKAPRQLARTASGRQQLVGWLKTVENGAAKSMPEHAGEAYDLAWMWEELGVSDLRR